MKEEIPTGGIVCLYNVPFFFFFISSTLQLSQAIDGKPLKGKSRRQQDEDRMTTFDKVTAKSELYILNL